MIPPTSRRIVPLRESPTRRIDRIKEKLQREGRDIILLSTGQPSIPPPRWVRELVREALVEDSMRFYRYSPSRGIYDLRRALAEDIALFGGPELDEDQIVITSGGQAAMFSTLASIIDEDSEVLVFDPMYFGYWPLLEYFGAKLKIVNLSIDDGYQPNLDKVLEVVARGKTRAIIIVTPDNPTGRVLDRGIARGLAEVANDIDAWIVVDEAYRTLIYEGEHSWFYEYAPENSIVIGTFSKDPGIPGWRLGYVYGPRGVIDKISIVSEEITYCPPIAAQYLVYWYLARRKDRLEHLEKTKQVYREKRDLAMKFIDKYLPRARYVKPRGSMFILVDLSDYLREKGVESDVFAEKLLEKKGVATVPGKYFGRTVPFSLRISFVAESVERMEKGIRHIGEFLEEL